MMLLAQAGQGLADSMSYGGTGGRGQQPNLLGSWLQMQQMKGEQDYRKAMLADREADNSFQQKKFEAEQASKQQELERRIAAAKAMGIDPNILDLNPAEFGSNYAERYGMTTLAPGEGAFSNGERIAYNPALLEVVPGGTVDRVSGAYMANQQMQADALRRALAGATKVHNPVTITQDTLAAKLAETPAAMFRKMSDAAYAAQAGMDATRSIYEMAKQNPDLFGPGMELKADVARRIESAKNLIAGGGQPSPDDARLLAVAKAVDVRQTNSAIAKLRDIGGNDTEKEYERVKAAIPGIETSLPSHEVTFIQEKTAADYLTNMQEYVARRTAQATQDRSLGMTTVDDAIREYKQANPLGEQLAANIQAVMQANGLTGGQPARGQGVPSPEKRSDAPAAELKPDPAASALADRILREAAAGTPLLGP